MHKITVGTPANKETVTVTALAPTVRRALGIRFTPALEKTHIRDEWAVSPGTGLDLAAPLKFKHAANLPFSDRGTGISFEPRTSLLTRATNLFRRWVPASRCQAHSLVATQ